MLCEFDCIESKTAFAIVSRKISPSYHLQSTRSVKNAFRLKVYLHSHIIFGIWVMLALEIQHKCFKSMVGPCLQGMA